MTVLQRDCNGVVIPWGDAPEGYDYWVVGYGNARSTFYKLNKSSARYEECNGYYWPVANTNIKVYKRNVEIKPSEKDSIEVSEISDTTLQDMAKTLSESITVTVAGTYEVFSPMVDEVVEFKDINLLKAYIEEYKIIMKLLGKEV